MLPAKPWMCSRSISINRLNPNAGLWLTCQSPAQDEQRRKQRMQKLKTIVIGLGNPILGDDGAGWKVVETLQNRLPDGVEVDFLAGGGLSVMERLVGCDRAVIVDAMNTEQMARGAVRSFPLESLTNPFLGHLGSAHETNLQTALSMGRSLGAHLPTQVMIVGIESPDVYDFDDTLSQEITAAVPQAAQAVLDILQNFASEEGKNGLT